MNWGALSDLDGDTVTYTVDYGVNNTIGDCGWKEKDPAFTTNLLRTFLSS